MTWMQDQRDPVSEWFDGPAWQLLERAYKRPGEWTPQYVSPPSQRARARLAVMGIAWDERDRWGEIRWIRAYKRSVYYNLRKHGYADGMRRAERTSDRGARACEWETGARTRQPGWPTSKWAIRIRLYPGGPAAHRAALAVPERKRWIDPRTGEPTDLQSTTADRDWL